MLATPPTGAVNAAGALLAAADPCAQQDSGDTMINLAKSLGNNQAMITAAKIFVQQPRNTPNSVAVKYCQRAPQNPELSGLYQCQFQGANEQQFANGQALGGPGTIPFGLSAPVNPLGSCPAHAQGPIPDGVQLSTLVSSPGTPANTSAPEASSTNSSIAASNSTSSSSSSSDDAGDTTFPAPQQDGVGSANNSASASSTSTSVSSNNMTSMVPVSTAAAPLATPSASSSGFQMSNGQTAQQQNAQFAGLTADSTCTEGQQACINGGFAQCVDGKFSITMCAGGTQCFALPLVNKAGTSIACTTQDDASSRIANTGATGGIAGSS